MKDPAGFLSALGVTLNCVVDSTATAILDDAHRTSIGYEMFFFHDEKAKRQFDNNITRHCGALTDPVTKARFRPTATSLHRYHDDRQFYFASDSTLQVFTMMPEMYADPAYEMLPKAADSSRIGQ